LGLRTESKRGGLGWLGWPVLLGLGALLAGCPNAGGAGAGEPDQMAQAEYGLAQDAFKRGKPREALEHVQKALDIDDRNADAAYLGAAIYLAFCALDERSSDCRYGEAERLARLAVDAAPEMRDAKNILGVILVNERRYEDAIAVLEPLAKDIIYASPEKAWGNLGWAYLKAGKTDQAIAALSRAVAAQPNYCVGLYWLGVAYQKKGQHQAAREALTRALDVPTGDCGRQQDAVAARAESLKALGLGDEARVDLERCRDLEPKTAVGKKCANELDAPK
jgi:type IV pilus assembly protein PilF